MWGQAHMISWYTFVERIIPTRVGTREVWAYAWCRLGDHPHACGDKTAHVNRHIAHLGSSPRVWGQVKPLYLQGLGVRIIPTRVGTSRIQLRHFQLRKDHPHACGDKHPSPRKNLVLLGSSPRVWGQDLVRPRAQGHNGIIPTRVGTRNYHPNR